MATKWRNPMRKTLPVQVMEILNRLDELETKGSGFGGSSVGAGLGEDHADVSPNLIPNPGFEDWTLTDCDYWQSAEDNDWNTGSHYAQETTTVYSLPYSVKLGDGANGSRGIAQESAFRVVPGESYYVSVRLLGGDADVEYAVILKALESDGVTEITTGTPLGSNWTYSAAFGGWYITGVAGTDWTRVTAPVTLAPDAIAEDVCYLRASIQYYQNGVVKYLYADDFAITRGSQLPAFSYYYLTEPSEPDAHKLLSLIHTDTLGADVIAGDLIFGNATPKWARLEKGDDGEVLKLVSGLPSWEAEGGGTTHSLLSATHHDTLPASVAAGDLIYGNSTPAWARLPKNANGELLYMLGGMPAWGLGPSSGALLYGLSGSAWGKLVAGTAGYVLTMYGGYPTWRPAPSPGVTGSGIANCLAMWSSSSNLAYIAAGTAGYVLTMYGGVPTWRPVTSPGPSGSGATDYVAVWSSATNISYKGHFTNDGVTFGVAQYAMLVGGAILQTDGVHSVILNACTWPVGHGTAGQALLDNGAGALYWGSSGGSIPDPITSSAFILSTNLNCRADCDGAGSYRIHSGNANVEFYNGLGTGNMMYAFSSGALTCVMNQNIVPNNSGSGSLGVSGQKWGHIWAVTTHFGDLGFSERACAVCSKIFKLGDSLNLIVKDIKSDGIATVPKHAAC